MSTFPKITTQIQNKFEEYLFGTPGIDVNSIDHKFPMGCGYFGCACCYMDKPYDAIDESCNECPLAKFAAEYAPNDEATRECECSSVEVPARDLLGALREAKEAGAKLVQLAMSANVCPLDEYIGELEQEDGDDPGNACYARFGRYIVNVSDAWEAGAEVYVLFD